MGHELTREARAGMPRGWSMAQRAVVLVLADICNDRTRRQPQHLDVSERLLEELDIPPGTLRNILTSLAEAGFEFRVAIGKDKHGRPMFAHRGRAVDYQFPAIPPRAPKGALGGASKTADNSEKGASGGAPLHSEGAPPDAPSAGKVHAGVLNGARRRAPQTTETPNDQKRTPGRVGDPIADKLPEDQDQDPSVAKSQTRRLPDGSGTVADDAQQFPPDHPESPAAGDHASASGPAPPARRCGFERCLTPELALPDDSRFHIGCKALARRVQRAQAEAVQDGNADSIPDGGRAA